MKGTDTHRAKEGGGGEEGRGFKGFVMGLASVQSIQSALRKSGIWPTDGSYIIKTITRPKLALPEKSSGLRPPMSAKAIHLFYTAYDKAPTVDEPKTVFATTLHLAALVSALEHEKRGLYKSIELQKKNYRQDVCLNPVGDANKGIIDCYSPGKVVQARSIRSRGRRLESLKRRPNCDERFKGLLMPSKINGKRQKEP